jgi:tetratricopeptide (TPR) repeat protein
VYIDFEGSKVDHKEDEDGSVFQVVSDWLVVIGDKDVTPALEMGLRFMRDGETSLIYGEAKYVYGLSGRGSSHNILPPLSNVMYRVRIKRLVPHSSEVFLSFNFQMEIAKSKKTIGNDCYNFEYFQGTGKEKVLMLYKKASDVLSKLVESCDSDEEKLQASTLLVDCINNMTAVYMKSKEYGKAKELASRVILLDPDNMTALLRAGRCALYDPNGSFEECSAAIAAAKAINSENKDLQKLQNEYRKKKKEYSQKSKQLMLKMSAAMVSDHIQPADSHENSKDMSTELAQTKNSVVKEQRIEPKDIAQFNWYISSIGKHAMALMHIVILSVAYVVYKLLFKDKN